MRKATGLAIGLLSVALASPVVAAGRTLVKLGTPAPDGSVWHHGLREMGDDWKRATDGQVMLRIYPGGIAGDGPDLVRKMRIGQLQAASLSIIGLAQIDYSFSVFNIPMFYDSYEELYYVMKELEPVMKKRLEDKGFVMLNWGIGGWVYFFTKEPVTSVDGFRKLKMFAAAGDDQWVQYWKNNGFRPVPLATTDILTGLQTGLIDGLPTTPLAALTLQWFRHTPYMLDLGLAPLIGATVVTKKTWERIPQAQRPALLQAALGLERTLMTEVPKQDDDAVVEMKKRGLSLTSPSDDGDDTRGWREQADMLALEMRTQMVAEDIFDLAVKARDEFRNKQAPAGGER